MIDQPEDASTDQNYKDDWIIYSETTGVLSSGASVIYDINKNEITFKETIDNYSNEVSIIEPFIPDNIEVSGLEELIENYSIIGYDDRKEVTNVNTFPYSTICFLEMNYFPWISEGTGTGVMVAKNALLTAAHNVYNEDMGGWVASISVKPGGVTSNFNTVQAERIVILNGWFINKDSDYDYALVILDQDIGAQTGSLGLIATSNNILLNKAMWNYSFPIDKQRGTMCSDDGKIRVATGSRSTRGSILHTASTFEGNSGGPIVLQSNNNMIVGIHNSVYDSFYNRGV